MPVYSSMPEHFGERCLAQTLADLDDGKLHLWFDLALPGVMNLDVVVWDEIVGVYVLETKAVPIEALVHFDDTSVEIADRGWGQSPVAQARTACYSLKDYLRRAGVTSIMIASSVAWPQVSRREWLGHWDSNSFPTGYELSMVFSEDIEGGLARFRERLRWIAEHPLWGATPTAGFTHKSNVFRTFANALRPAARATQARGVSHPAGVSSSSSESDAETEDGSVEGATVRTASRPDDGSYRGKIWLGTEHVIDAATAALETLERADPLLGPEWKTPFAERIGEIVRRLEQPFKLGVIGEFRAGKSSLVNVLIGQQVALVEEMECTFAPQRFYYAPEHEARLIHRDGRAERVSGEMLMAMFREAYATRKPLDVARTEVGLPAPILQAMDIWDSPGLGGSDENAETAQRFADTVDAALWVFDAGYSGQRALSPMISRLEEHGKAIIGVVNKCEYMTAGEAERVIEVLRQAYRPLKTADLVPFSALFALNPENDRDGDLDWAVDGSGNLHALLDVIRETILSSPGRLTGRAAAGDLRATLSAARDDVKAAMMDLMRRQYLYQSEMEKAEKLLHREISLIGTELERGAMLALRDRLVMIGLQAIDSTPDKRLRDTKNVKQQMHALLAQITPWDLTKGYLAEQQGWIEDRLRNVLRECGSSFSKALTPIERYGDSAVVHVPGTASASGMELTSKSSATSNAGTADEWFAHFDVDNAVNVGTTVLAVLGTIALMVPGPQWMVVIPGALISGCLGGLIHRRLSPEQIRDALKDHWHRQVNEYLHNAKLRPQLNQMLRGWCESLHGAVQQDVRALLQRNVLSEAGESDCLRRLDQLSAINMQFEMVMERLGNPLFALPPADDMLSQAVSIPVGERERTQELLRRVLGLARDVAAITDGAFSVTAMPLLLEVPDDVTVRVLAWEQPLSELSPTFRAELEALRGKRSGHISVAAPVRVGPSEDALPSGAWVFMPGKAFHFSLPLYETWMASGPVRFEPFEDAGNLYNEHFGRWWNGEVEGFQTLHVQRRPTDAPGHS